MSESKATFHYEAILSVDGVNSMTEHHCSKFIRSMNVWAKTKQELKEKLAKLIDEMVIDIN